MLQNAGTVSQVPHEQIIFALTPLLENNHPTQEICDFFSKVMMGLWESNLQLACVSPVKHNRTCQVVKWFKALAHLLEYSRATQEICDLFSKVCNAICGIEPTTFA